MELRSRIDGDLFSTDEKYFTDIISAYNAFISTTTELTNRGQSSIYRLIESSLNEMFALYEADLNIAFG